ncbi:alcohol dehydrogenase [Thermoplasmatales archaeon ex4484_36]|nr:MAG: alcohol dehydrogenase [Thermoplasmatales archaeon ex4484_36]
MKAALYYSNSDIRIVEMDKPRAGMGEIVVKMRRCGICGSDLMEWYRVRSAPRVLGHEMVGEIVEVGEGVEKYSLGERVFVSHHVPCNTCHWCLKGHHSVCDTLRRTNYHPGGFAEYIKVPPINVERGVFLLPPELTWDEGVFIEPLGCVVRGQRMAGVETGDSVLVVGVGVTGILHLKYAKALGASTLLAADVNPFKLMMAKRAGADHTIDAKGDVGKKTRDLLGRGADVVIVTAPVKAAFDDGFRSVDRGGSVLLFAPLRPEERYDLNVWEIWRDEVKVVTSYAASPRDLEVAIEVLRSGRVEVEDMVTHHFPLSAASEAFRVAVSGERSLKVILHPDDEKV